MLCALACFLCCGSHSLSCTAPAPLRPFVHLSPQIPPLFEGEATKEKLKTLGPLAPLTIHLRQEIDR